jgi:hypothetical protein
MDQVLMDVLADGIGLVQHQPAQALEKAGHLVG